jgi:hypothetical protein
MTKQEVIMFEQGWVSAHMAAERLGVNVVTIHRLVYDGKIKPEDTQKLGRVRFIRIKALANAHEPNIRAAFRLDDWSDVTEKVRLGSSLTQRLRSDKA